MHRRLQAVSAHRFSLTPLNYFPDRTRRLANMSEAVSLDYTPDRATELKENIDAVLHEIDETYQAAESHMRKVYQTTI